MGLSGAKKKFSMKMQYSPKPLVKLWPFVRYRDESGLQVVYLGSPRYSVKIKVDIDWWLQ